MGGLGNGPFSAFVSRQAMRRWRATASSHGTSGSGEDRRRRTRIDEVDSAPLPLSPSKRTFVIACAMSLKCQEHKVAALQPAARGQCTRSTKSLRDSEASGLSESAFASAKDLNDEPR